MAEIQKPYHMTHPAANVMGAAAGMTRRIPLTATTAPAACGITSNMAPGAITLTAFIVMLASTGVAVTANAACALQSLATTASHAAAAAGMAMTTPSKVVTLFAAT